MPQAEEFVEPWRSGFGVAFDNDVFAGSDGDRDYTGGVAAAFGGRRASEWIFSVDPVLRWLDERTGFQSLYDVGFHGEKRHALQFGLLVFTPDDIETSLPIRDDRPYANLIFMTNSQFSLRPVGRTMYQSSFTIGLLGTKIAEALQKGVHTVTGGAKPHGFGNQISHGGEPTIRYAVGRHALLSSGLARGRSYDLKLATEGSLGYLTEVSVALAVRWGRINTPWWSSTSEYADYAAQPAAMPARRAPTFQAARESYWWGGIRIRTRVYNAFLQGQIRDSVVTFSASELNRVVFEAWVGFTTDFGGLRLSYALRYQTREIKRGRGARDLTWAGLTLQKGFGCPRRNCGRT